VTTELFPINTKEVRLAYELVQGQKFFKYKIKSALRFSNNSKQSIFDYTYFKDIEAASLCSEMTIRIDKLCANNKYVTKWSGQISIGKGKFDDDKCVVEFTPDDLNDYDCLLAGNEYNILDIADRVSVNLLQPVGAAVPNGILFADVLDFLVKKCPGILGVKSEFYQINPDTPSVINYVTGEFNTYTQLVAYQITDFTSPPPTNKALVSKTSFKEIAEDLANIQNVYWTIEAGYIRLEHSSYFFQSVGLDLTQTQFANFLVAQNKYEYLFNKKFKYEEWSLPDSYQGGRITYSDACVSGDEKESKTTHGINILYTDTIPPLTGTITDLKRILLIATETIGPDILILSIGNDGTCPDMVLGNLIMRFFRNDRFYENATFEYFASNFDDPAGIIDKTEKNYGDFRPVSVDSLFVQKNLHVQLCCEDSDIDPNKLIKSNFGNGIIQSFDIDIIRNSANMSLEHGRKSLVELTPNQISNLKGWWKSDVGVSVSGTDVTQWDDQSGQGNHFISPAGQEPQYIASFINGLPAIDFLGGQAMATASFNWAPVEKYTYFIVFKGGSITSHAHLFGTKDLPSGNHFGISFDTGGADTELENAVSGKNWKLTYSGFTPFGSSLYHWVVFNENRDGSTSYGWHSGKRHRTTADSNPMAHTVPVDAAPLYIGARYNAGVYDLFFYGQVAEIIFYDRNITEIERQNVEQYLFKKYAYLQSYIRY
jgi:hypothetical protein